jgi:iron-sulfur cluster assembly protein
MINMTEKAIQETKKILKEQNKEDWGIRVGVKGGGCSGLEYLMNFEKESSHNDRIIEFNEIKMFVDPKSYLYLNGLELDFSTELMNGGFKFNHAGATQCACGSSFKL